MEKKNTRCSFCGREVEEVDQIVSGINANICNECIEICHSMLEHQERTKKQERLEKLPTPVEIKKILDEYIIQQDDAKKALSVAVYNISHKYLSPHGYEFHSHATCLPLSGF